MTDPPRNHGAAFLAHRWSHDGDVCVFVCVLVAVPQTFTWGDARNTVAAAALGRMAAADVATAASPPLVLPALLAATTSLAGGTRVAFHALKESFSQLAGAGLQPSAATVDAVVSACLAAATAREPTAAKALAATIKACPDCLRTRDVEDAMIDMVCRLLQDREATRVGVACVCAVLGRCALLHASAPIVGVDCRCLAVPVPWPAFDGCCLQVPDPAGEAPL